MSPSRSPSRWPARTSTFSSRPPWKGKGCGALWSREVPVPPSSRPNASRDRRKKMKLTTAVKSISTAALILGLSGLLPAAENPVLFKNGQVITVRGETIPGGDILIQGTKIVMVGKGLSVPAGAEVIDLKG